MSTIGDRWQFSGPQFEEAEGSQHFTILSLTVDQGTGEAHCLAHYLIVDGGKRRLTIAALRYYVTLAKMDGAWRYAERLLYVDRIEERVLS